ncbi:DUF5412 family protein [Priestia megaterium]|uniref:DUF5412 family protein n=1 Tax=Priestia megaterium TaxID=1404 RepID=UPI003D965AAE
MKKFLIIFSSAIILILIVCFIIWRILFAPDYLPFVPKGEYVSQSTSPNGEYTVKIYQSGGGATTDFAIRGELTDNNKIFNKKKNIYWNYPQETAKVKWIDNNTVNISGHKIDVKTETFDYRDE